MKTSSFLICYKRKKSREHIKKVQKENANSVNHRNKIEQVNFALKFSAVFIIPNTGRKKADR